MFGMGVTYGLLRLPKMPEVKQWRDRVKKQKESQQADEEVQTAGNIDWSDREVDVSSLTAVLRVTLPSLTRSHFSGITSLIKTKLERPIDSKS